MSTTYLKMPDNVNAKAAATAAEERARFVAEAHAARETMLKGGQGLDAEEVHAYLRARVEGRAVNAPQTRPWRG